MLQNFTLGSFAQGVSAGGGAFESIASVTASGGETSLSFTSIPGTYKHLQIRGIYKDTATGGTYDNMRVTFNSDSGANYGRHSLLGNGSTVSATGIASDNYIPIEAAANANATTTTYGVSILDIHDYASTTRNKTLRSFSGCDLNGSGAVALCSGVWLSTNAITTVTLTKGFTSFRAGSTFALYGIKGA